MKINDLLRLHIPSRIQVLGPSLDSRLIKRLTRYCGFQDTPHIVGATSILSLARQKKEGKCLAGMALLCLMSEALSRGFSFEEPYDAVQRSMNGVRFCSPCMEDDALWFNFHIVKKQKTHFALLSSRKTVPEVRITFKCRVFTPFEEKERTFLTVDEWVVSYYALSSLPQ